MSNSFLLSLGVLLPALLALIRLRNMDTHFYWFVLFLWLGVFSELVNRYFISRFGSNAIPWNIYNLGEFLALMMMFRNWDLGEKFKKWFQAFIFLSVLFWLAEILFIGHIRDFNSYFAIYYCFVVVICAVTELNQLIVTEKKSIVRNPRFIISMGLLIFFTFRIFVESLLMPILSITKDFFQRIFGIQIYINLLVNLIYLIAAACIPKKKTYISL